MQSASRRRNHADPGDAKVQAARRSAIRVLQRRFETLSDFPDDTAEFEELYLSSFVTKEDVAEYVDRDSGTSKSGGREHRSFCTQCGVEFGPADKFCASCGVLRPLAGRSPASITPRPSRLEQPEQFAPSRSSWERPSPEEVAARVLLVVIVLVIGFFVVPLVGGFLYYTLWLDAGFSPPTAFAVGITVGVVFWLSLAWGLFRRYW